MSRGTNRLKVSLIVISVFTLGAVTGASLDGVYRMQANNALHETRAGTSKEKLFDTLKHDLKLTDTQTEQMEAIIEKARTEYRSLRMEVRPRYEVVRHRALSEIRDLLTLEQEKIFDVTVAKRDVAR